MNARSFQLSDSLKNRTTCRCNLPSLSEGSKLLLHTCMSTAHHAPTSPRSSWEGGPDNLRLACQRFKQLIWVSVCTRACMCLFLAVTIAPVTTKAKVFHKHHADCHFPSSVTWLWLGSRGGKIKRWPENLRGNRTGFKTSFNLMKSYLRWFPPFRRIQV